VGVVLPGYVATEGFPHEDLLARRATRRLVSTPEKVAGAIVKAAGGRAEVSVPRPFGLVPKLRVLAPGLWRRLAMGVRR
jgi:uncharacterized protein